MNRWIILLFMLIVTQSINAQTNSYTFLEYENLSHLNDQKWINPQVNVLGSGNRDGSRIGTYFFASVNPHWGQAYGGLSYQLSPWLRVNTGVGLETDSLPCRFNISSFITLNKLSLLQIYEYGGSGFWYSIILNYALRPNLKTGWLFKRYYGFGPNFEWDIGKSSAILNIAPVYDFEFDQAKLMVIFRYVI